MLLFTFELYCIILALAVNVDAMNFYKKKGTTFKKYQKTKCKTFKNIITTENCECGSYRRSNIFIKTTKVSEIFKAKYKCSNVCKDYKNCSDDHDEDWQDFDDANYKGGEYPNVLKSIGIKSIDNSQKLDYDLHSDIQHTEEDLPAGEESSSPTAKLLATFSSDNISDTFDKCDLIGGKSQCFKAYQLMNCYRKEMDQGKQKAFIEDCNLKSPYKEFKVSFESGKDSFRYKKAKETEKSSVENAKIETVAQFGTVSELNYTGVLNLNRVLDFTVIEDDDEFYEICEVSQGKSKCFAALLLRRCFENLNVNGEWRTASKKCDFEQSPFKEFNEDFEKYKIRKHDTETFKEFNEDSEKYKISQEDTEKLLELFNECTQALCLKVIQRQSKAGITFDVEWNIYADNPDSITLEIDVKTLENRFRRVTGFSFKNNVVTLSAIPKRMLKEI